MIKWINKKRNQKGFTLIELVVVIAILGILMAIAVPRLGGFRQSAEKSADEATAETIAKAAEMYIAANGEAAYTALAGAAGTPADFVKILSDAKLIEADVYTPQQSGKSFAISYAGDEFVVTVTP